MKAFKKTLALILAVVMVVSVAAMPASASENKFTDVAEADWFYDSVTRWTNAGVINGMTATTFAPNAPMKRGEFAKVMSEVLGLTGEAESVFADKAHWSDAYVDRCYAKGIVNGYPVDGKLYFYPELEITREQAFAMMVRALNINAGSEEVLGQFDDADDVSNWAKKENSTATLITYGAVIGDNEGKLSPKESITRAEVLKILDRLVGVHVSKEGVVTTATADTDKAIEAGAKTCGIVVVHSECVANVQLTVKTVEAGTEEEPAQVNQIVVVVTDKDGATTTAEVIPTNSSTTTDEEGNEVEEQPIILVTTNIETKEEEGEKQENIPLVPDQKVEISGTTEEQDKIEVEIVPACEHKDMAFEPNYDGTHTGKCQCGETVEETCSFLEGGNICYYCGFDRTAGAVIGNTYFETLAEALEAAEEGDTVKMLADVTTEEILEISNITLDGNGHTITKTGDGRNTTEAGNPVNAAILTTGGTFKNLNFANGTDESTMVMRAISVINALTTDLVIDNCKMDATYALHLHSAESEYEVVVTNTELLGWVSYDQSECVTFEDCTFGKDSTGYAHLRPHHNTVLTNCTFEEGYTFGTGNWETEAFEITLTDCVYGEEKVTAANFIELLAGELGTEYSLPGMATVTVNGEEVDFTAAKIGDVEYPTLQAAIAAAKEGDTVTLTKDVTTAESIKVNGITLDGNGHTITMTKAEDTLDAAILTTGGTIQNLTVTGGARAIFVANNTASDLVIDNCVLDSVYALNITQVAPVEYTLTVTDSELYGWTSYGLIKAASFSGCTFGEGSTGEAHLRSYVNTELTECTFEDGFTMDANKEDRARHTVALTDCVYGEEKITAANFTELTLCDLEGECNLAADAVVTVNGEQVSFLPVADVVESKEFVNVELPWGSYDRWSPTEGLDSLLETAYTFTCVDTEEEALASEYADWYCDFFVKLDRDLGANQIFVGGNYDPHGWIGFHNGEVTLTANEELPLLGSVANAPWTYADVATQVGTFICGAGDVDNALSGATFTVMLRLTNPEDATEYYDVATINYTFE